MNLAIGLVGVNDIDKARAAYTVGQRNAPEHFKSRLEGTWPYARLEDSKRATTFLRIAAGIEDPNAGRRVAVKRAGGVPEWTKERTGPFY